MSNVSTTGTPRTDLMSVLTPRAKPAEPTEFREAIPPLENGDRLTRPEFERRYEAMPHLKRAELIEGEVYVGSRVRHRRHSKPHSQIHGWLSVYVAGTPGVDAGDNGSIRLDLDNEPQPDAYLMIQPEHGGQARISEDDYVEGPPELVAEIASSSVSYDLGKKLNSYRRNGVLEYVVWRCLTSGLIGSCSMKGVSNRWPRGSTVSCAVECSPDYGSIRPRSSVAILRPSWHSSNRA